MNSFITLCLVHTTVDPELARATAIRRSFRQGHPHVEAVLDQPVVTNLGASYGSIAGGVVDVGGSHAHGHADVASSMMMSTLILKKNKIYLKSSLTMIPLHPHVLSANIKSAWTNRINSFKNRCSY